MSTSATGHCLCGGITFSAKLLHNHIDACHCTMCQHWSGGPFIGVECAAGDLALTGEDKITLYPSSEWAERAFCSQCGSHLFYRFKPTGQFGIPLGLLDSQDGLQFTQQIFVDQKSSCYEFANKTKEMTGAEVIAEFGG